MLDADLLILAPIGLVAGMLGGMLGIGGSVLMIPAMVLLLDNPNQHLFQGAAMIVNFFVALPSALQHRRAGAILRPIVRVTIPTAAVSVVVGVWLSSGAWFRGDREVFLSRLFGGFLLYAVAYNVYRLMSHWRLPDMNEADAASIPPWKIAATVGAPMGVAGGLLGIGGGLLAVPLQQLFLRMPLRRAIANSAATIVLLSVIGAACKNYANARAGIPFADAARLALVLAPTAVVGGYIGGRLTHVVPRQALRVVVILLMCYGGVLLIRRPARTAADEVSVDASRTPVGVATAPEPSAAKTPRAPRLDSFSLRGLIRARRRSPGAASAPEPRGCRSPRWPPVGSAQRLTFGSPIRAPEGGADGAAPPGEATKEVQTCDARGSVRHLPEGFGRWASGSWGL